MSKAEELLHKLTDGRRHAGICLLSKKQSSWFRTVLIKEQGYGFPATVGAFSVRAMGRQFNRNNNGSVIHVMHANESAVFAAVSEGWDLNRLYDDIVKAGLDPRKFVPFTGPKKNEVSP